MSNPSQHIPDYPRSEAGEHLRRTALQAAWDCRLAQDASMTDEEMISYLQSKGYAILTPEELKGTTCPWCGAGGES